MQLRIIIGDPQCCPHMQAVVSGSGLNTSTDKTDQMASPTKQQALSTEASNASKEMTINAKVLLT